MLELAKKERTADNRKRMASHVVSKENEGPAPAAGSCMKKIVANVSFPRKRSGKVSVVSCKRAFLFGKSGSGHSFSHSC